MSRKPIQMHDLPAHIQERVRERTGLPADDRSPPTGKHERDAEASEGREDARAMLVRLATTCITGEGDLPADGWPEYTNHQLLARMVKLTLGRDSDV